MKSFLLALILCLFSKVFAQETERVLTDAVKDYSTLQSDIEKMLKLKCPECDSIAANPSTHSFCSFKEFCEKPEIKKDEPILYKNEKGEKILNERYYNLRDDIRSCLRERYADEINGKREELALKLKTQYLQKMMAANKKLQQLISKYNQGNAVAKVSGKILNMSIEAGLNGEDFGWEKKGTSAVDLAAIISVAEKDLKLSLVPEIKKTLAEIQYLKYNQTYEDEVNEMDRALIPEIVPADPFFDWKKLKEAKSAGGQAALLENRKKLAEKTQQAYGVFQETQEEILSYLESKKNKANAAMIERAKEKVKTISFNPPRITETLEKHCQGPNAFYSAKTHSFTICPQMLNFPKMALVETIAHEVAHSIDSCNLSQVFLQKKGPSIAEEAPFEIELKTTGVSKNYTTSFYGTDSNPKNVIQEAMKYKDHPFSSTMSCLKNPKSVGVQTINVDEVKMEVKKALEEMKKKTNGSEKNNTDISYLSFLNEHAEDYFDYMEGCSFGSEGNKGMLRSQMQEAFADKISSEIVAGKLKGLSKQEAEKSILEIGLSYGKTCPNYAPAEKKLIDFAQKEGCPRFFANRSLQDKILRGMDLTDPQFDEHPETNVRLDRNLLAHPAIRKSLNCPQNKGVIYCE